MMHFIARIEHLRNYERVLQSSGL